MHYCQFWPNIQSYVSRVLRRVNQHIMIMELWPRALVASLSRCHPAQPGRAVWDMCALNALRKLNMIWNNLFRHWMSTRYEASISLRLHCCYTISSRIASQYYSVICLSDAQYHKIAQNTLNTKQIYKWDIVIIYQLKLEILPYIKLDASKRRAGKRSQWSLQVKTINRTNL